MTRLEQRAAGTLNHPLPIVSFPFVDTIEVDRLGGGPDEPSPCLATATAAWYTLQSTIAGLLVVDVTGSTPRDAVVRLYRSARLARRQPVFLGCASPVWNGHSALETPVRAGEAFLVQVGTSESSTGRLVVRVELQG